MRCHVWSHWNVLLLANLYHFSLWSSCVPLFSVLMNVMSYQHRPGTLDHIKYMWNSGTRDDIVNSILFSSMRLSKVVRFDHIHDHITLSTSSAFVAPIWKRFKQGLCTLFHWFYISMYKAFSEITYLSINIFY